MTATDRIDLSKPLAEIAEKIGENYHRIAKWTITTNLLTAEIYDLDDQGSKFIDPETGYPATRTFHWTIRT